MTVLYEDNHIIAVNKTCNEIVQGDKTGDTPLSEMVKAYIKDKYNKPGEVFLGVTHRLDRPTSGVVLFARTSKALTRLNEMFKEKSVSPKDGLSVKRSVSEAVCQSGGRSIKKTYWAIPKHGWRIGLHAMSNSISPLSPSPVPRTPNRLSCPIRPSLRANTTRFWK